MAEGQLKELLEKIDDLIENENLTKSFLDELADLETKALDAVAEGKAEARGVMSDENAEIVAQDSLRETLEAAETIYNRRLLEAVEKFLEYKYAAFLVPLEEVGKDKNLYLTTFIGTGWSQTIIVSLDMNAVAGNLADYADAVDAAREDDEIKEGRNPQRASDAWKKLYGTKTRGHIISNRISHFTSGKAPFWSLLNNGNKKVTMSSDIGGTPYPSHGPTRFVDHIEDDLEKYFKDAMVEGKREYQRMADRILDLIAALEDGIERLRSSGQTAIDNLEEFDAIENRLRTQSLSQVDPAKLLKAIDDARAGRIPKGKRVSLGGGIRLRPSSLALYD